MYKKPNMYDKPQESRERNDLYRKFHDYFVKVTEKEFNQFGTYSIEGYVSVNKLIENALLESLNHDVDKIVPVTGSTGIGKTYLMLYTLKTFYKEKDIFTNHPMICKTAKGYDLLYYSDFNITEKDVLENPTKLMLAKIEAMCERISDFFDVDVEPVDNFIKTNKLEVKYYLEKNIEYQKALYKLTNLLNNEKVLIRNIVFVFDDLESLSENQQFYLIENFLTLYENLKSKSHNKYKAKFFFCLRNSTYYNIYKNDFYNTHRADKELYLNVAPSLSEVFEKRFDIILNSENIKNSPKKDTWIDAKDILLRISRRVDTRYTNLLVNLNNGNVSNALEDFLHILSNRRWTQKNVNIRANFKIEEKEYYINDTNILRILSMDERNIYYQSTAHSIRCILPEPGVSPYADLISLIILQAYRFKNSTNVVYVPMQSRLISEDELSDRLIDCIVDVQEQNAKGKKEEINKIIKTSINYYKENRFIRKNIDPQEENDENSYFMLPRGEQIFDLFFSSSILFNIFRDAFLWNDTKFAVDCSYKLSFEELIFEAIKYFDVLYDLESRLFKKIKCNKKWRIYVSLVGEWSAAQSFLEGLKKSIAIYYNEYPIPDTVTEKITIAEDKTKELTDMFVDVIEEDALF